MPAFLFGGSLKRRFLFQPEGIEDNIRCHVAGGVTKSVILVTVGPAKAAQRIEPLRINTTEISYSDICVLTPICAYSAAKDASDRMCDDGLSQPRGLSFCAFSCGLRALYRIFLHAFRMGFGARSRHRCRHDGMARLNSRDNLLWLQSWRDRRTDFHQRVVNPFLAEFWPKLQLTPGSRVFVPLCGKSLDMLWLARQGYEVVGVELSPIAVEALFRENGIRPCTHKVGAFTVWQGGGLTILCGDYFALTPMIVGRIDAVYDRAALTALPETVRAAYVTHLRTLVSSGTEVFLLTIEDAAPGDSLAQALGVGEEITRLFAAEYEIDLAHVESVFEADPEVPAGPPIRVEYKVYRLMSRFSGC